MKLLRAFAVFALIALAVPASHAQTITGAQAQKSPQADVFLAYEKALIGGGLNAARQYMTPAKPEELNSMVKNWGEEGFQQFLGRMRSGAQGEARR